MTTTGLPPAEDKPRGCYNCGEAERACKCPPEPERPDLDAWRAEAEAVAPLADAATRGPWIPSKDGSLVMTADDNGPDLFEVLPHPRSPTEPLDFGPLKPNAAFIAAARTGWPRDAARVGVLCAEVARLDALPSQLRAAFQDPAGDWPTSDCDKLRRIAALLGIEFEEPT